VQFSGSGSSALVAISKGNAPLKTLLAFNDQVLQWIVGRPNIKTMKDLSGKKVATTGAEVSSVVPPQRAYDFSFARQAEQQLNKQGWKP
jgi:TRAP-type uncharacterized transport system substrate-binding protein